VGRELGVRVVLEGSVLRIANRIQINIQLADAVTNSNRWAQGFDIVAKDIFAVQDDILRKIVTTIGLLFRLDDLRVPQASLKPTDSLEAFDYWLRGEESYWRLTKQDNINAQVFFDKAVALDPKYSDAYAELAFTHTAAVLFQWSLNPPADLKRASELAQKALAIDDSNSRALAIVSWIDLFEGRPEQGIADGLRAIALNPNSAYGFFALGNAFTVDGKPERAITTIEKAIRVDPESEALYAGGLGIVEVFLRRYPAAVPLLEQHVAAYPNDTYARSVLTIAYSELGRDQDAHTQASEIVRLNPQYRLPAPDALFSKNLALARRYLADLGKAGLK
jgi:adenylate cyclase